MSKKQNLQKAVEWVKKKSAFNIKAVIDGYEDPKAFISRTTEEKIQPDVSFQSPGGAKHFSVISTKKSKTRDLITKWKLLSLKASIKRGKLHLLAPRGSKMFTQNLVDKYNINALVYSI